MASRPQQAAQRSALTGQSEPRWSDSDRRSISCLGRPHPRPMVEGTCCRNVLLLQRRLLRSSGSKIFFATPISMSAIGRPEPAVAISCLAAWRGCQLCGGEIALCAVAGRP